MNNDFNYKPQQRPNTAADDTAQPTSSSVEEPADTAGERPQVVTSPSGGSGAGKKLAVTLLVIVLLALAAGGVYYWQQQQVKDLTASKNDLQSQVSSLKTELAKKNTSATATKSTPTTSTTSAPDVVDIVTVSPTTVGTNTALVSTQYSAKATELWVESGTKPDQLTTIAKHVKANGETDMQNFNLTGLAPGTRYYYRAAGLIDGKTVDGGIVSFITTK